MTKTRHDPLRPPGYRHPDDYTEAQLHNRLVGDASTGVATPLQWAIHAYTRIGRLNGRGPEDAYAAVRAEVYERTGNATMPMT